MAESKMKKRTGRGILRVRKHLLSIYWGTDQRSLFSDRLHYADEGLSNYSAEIVDSERACESFRRYRPCCVVHEQNEVCVIDPGRLDLVLNEPRIAFHCI